MTSTLLRTGVAAFALALFALPALAQTPPAPGGWRQPGAGAEHRQEMMQKHREAMAHDLHTILNIRPDQEAAFSAFQASMVRPPRDGKMKRDHAAMDAMTTPQKLDMMQARMAEHMARMQQHIAALKTFYAALSPEQQRVFDALHRMHGGMGGHWGGHGGMGGHGMHGGPEGMMHGPDQAPPPPPGA